MTKVRDIEHWRKSAIIKEVDIQNYNRMVGQCPFCGEYDEISRDLLDVDDEFFPEIRVPVDCGKCEKKWFEVYKLKELWVRSK